MKTNRITFTLLLFGALAQAVSLSSPVRAETAARAAKPAIRAEKAAHAAAPLPTPSPLVLAVARVELTVSSLARAQHFFESVLGFRAAAATEERGAFVDQLTGVTGARALHVTLTLGSEELVLTEYPAPVTGRPVPRDTHGNDLWFQHLALVVSDMDRAYAWLRAQRVAHISSLPQTLPRSNRAAAGIKAFYFADPDGHPLELLEFPRGKGDPRWQNEQACTLEPRERCLFLGIDHTAITVEDTATSLAFYRDRLGLRVAGESENFGVEQEHLNGVFGAHLRITALRAARGPGVELLEYLSPRGGRLAPSDAKPSDLFHYQVVMQVPSVTAFTSAARADARRTLVDPAGRAVLLRDPDGHAILGEEAAR